MSVTGDILWFSPLNDIIKMRFFVIQVGGDFFESDVISVC